MTESSKMVVFLIGIPLPHLRWLPDTYEKGVIALNK